jgi:hypothetical protein
MKFNICLIQPDGYVHALALLEAAEYCEHQLRRFGHESNLTKNFLSHDGVNIIFGAHISPASLHDLKANTIIFNTEQLAEDSVWMNKAYKKILLNHYVWDYSQSNLKFIPHVNKSLISFYYEQKLNRIPDQSIKEWDLIFYGSINERRKKILEELTNRGLKLKTIFGVYGADRDVLIGRSRAVLNLHFYDAQLLQQIRIFYPLINQIPVISENYPLSSAPDVYGDCIFTPGDKRFTDYVVRLIKSDRDFASMTVAKSAKFYETRENADIRHSIEHAINFLSI